MAIRERFGKFVLLEKLESFNIGEEYRAAKIGAQGLERFVRLLRFSPKALLSPQAAQALIEQIKFAAQIQHPAIARIFGMGTIRGVPYIAYEFIEGRSLLDVIRRARREMFPVSTEHALVITTRVRDALDQLHTKKTDTGAKYYHGYVNPFSVLVTYEGDIRLRGAGFWPSGLSRTVALSEDETPYLAPEQQDDHGAETRSDIYALGCLMFEMLIGEPPFRADDAKDVGARLSAARMRTSIGDEVEIPAAISDILRHSLAQDPAQRYGQIKDLRKPLESLLFGSDYSATTFNLAFFMHTLFRDEIDKESKAYESEKKADYSEFTKEQTPLPTAPALTTTPAPVAAPVDRRSPIPRPVVATPLPVTPPQPQAPSPIPPAPDRVQPPTLLTPVPSSATSRPTMLTPIPASSMHTPVPRPATMLTPIPISRRPTAAPASDFAFEIPSSKPRSPLFYGAIIAGVLAAILAGFGLLRGRLTGRPMGGAAPTTQSGAALAIEKNISDLEERLKKLQADRDPTGSTTASPAPAGGAPASVKAGASPDRERQKQNESIERAYNDERRRLEELKRIEVKRLADERQRAHDDELRRQAATPASKPADASTATAPAASTVYQIDDPGVTTPVLRQQPALEYPAQARSARVEGAVVVSCVIDESGRVVSARIVDGNALLRDAALQHVKGRRYSPATRGGTPVKVQMNVRVVFRTS